MQSVAANRATKTYESMSLLFLVQRCWLFGFILFLIDSSIGRVEALALGNFGRADTSSHSSVRRSLWESAFGAGLFICAPNSCCATDEIPHLTKSRAVTKPYAPPSALLPATRCKLWVDEAQQLASKISTEDKQSKHDLLLELNQILQNRPKLFVNEAPLSRTKTSSAQITTIVSSANKLDSRSIRQNLNLGDQIAVILNQADVERQWGILQYSESQRERSNELRAALNYYTQQLQFDGDRYLLTASKEDRKRLIRNEELPSLTTVVTSDLDLRDLYRNQFLTSVEDAKAEVAYQVKQPPDDIEYDDVQDLMKSASIAMSNWFDLIDPSDVNDAISAVQVKR